MNNFFPSEPIIFTLLTGAFFVGLLVAYLIGKITKKQSFEVVGEMICWILIGILGGWLYSFLGFSSKGFLFDDLIIGILGFLGFCFSVGTLIFFRKTLISLFGSKLKRK
jgi:uncharacterized membrane protein YeaQ/YmgE (transglycosylase-associated protein family)